jgi:predicted esterase YcpF (UPF0227 family)
MIKRDIQLNFDYFDKKYDNLIVFFSGVIGKNKGYNFYNIAKFINCRAIFVRDYNINYYQGKNFSESVKTLNDKIASAKIKKVIFIGISMGGYGAIKFSEHVKVDKMVLFSPQIEYLSDYNKYVPIGRRAENILYKFQKKPIETIIYVCDKTDWETDLKEAKELKNSSNLVTVNYESCDTHTVSKFLHENKKLIPILRKHCE